MLVGPKNLIWRFDLILALSQIGWP